MLAYGGRLPYRCIGTEQKRQVKLNDSMGARLGTSCRSSK